MKKEIMKYTSVGHRVFVWTIITVVLVVVALGLWLAGSPAQERARRIDEIRVSDLQNISNSIDQYFNINKTLPPDLITLSKARDMYYINSINDPETDLPYEYSVRGNDAYTLCATFDTNARMKTPAPPEPRSVPITGSGSGAFWEHGAEHTCFNITAINQNPKGI